MEPRLQGAVVLLSRDREGAVVLLSRDREGAVVSLSRDRKGAGVPCLAAIATRVAEAGGAGRFERGSRHRHGFTAKKHGFCRVSTVENAVFCHFL